MYAGEDDLVNGTSNRIGTTNSWAYEWELYNDADATSNEEWEI